MLGKVGLAASLAGLAMGLTGVAVNAGSVPTVSGFEIAATATDGHFVGTINGGPLQGGFYANIYHSALPTAVGGTAAICGTGENALSHYPPVPCSPAPGPISTVTVHLATGASLVGEFAYADPGITNLTNPGGVCLPQLFSTATQKFSVSDAVTFGATPYAFVVTLTHYLINLGRFGGCQTYFATVAGRILPLS